MGLFLHHLLLLLGQMEGQDAVLIPGMDVLLLHMLPYIEAAAHASGIALTPDVSALLVLLVLVQAD